MYQVTHNKRSLNSTTPSTLAFKKQGRNLTRTRAPLFKSFRRNNPHSQAVKSRLTWFKYTPRRADRFALETNSDSTTRSHSTILTQPQPGGEVVQLNFYTTGSVLDDAQAGEVYFEAIHF